MIAVPKKPRPHQLELQPKNDESLKQRLIRQIAQGDTSGAEATRAEIAVEKLRIERAHIKTETCRQAYIIDGEVVESIELTATPEAADYFAPRSANGDL
ncbi:MAG: hypothetical protein HRT76_09090 [Halieaceae bacterium]|nr:hypothetical protein [Halieaceae bacterium]